MSDAGYLYSSPVRWKVKDWLKIGGIAGIGFGLYSFDDNIQNWVSRSKTETSSDISSITEKFGNTGSTSVALGVIFLTGLITKSEKMRNVSLLAIKTSLLSGLLAQTFKNIGHRSRPNAGLGKNSWSGPEIGGKHKAFPSGHTTTAFALATTFAQTYKNKKWVGITSYSVASLAGLSRVHDNKHWATDVFTGAALGYFSAKAILGNEARNGRKLSIFPSSQFNTPNLTLLIPLY